MPQLFYRPRKLVVLALACILGIATSAAQATSLNIPPAPAIGSRNVATADLLVARPTTQPCTVPLFSQVQFADFNAKPFNYTPPASCKGPWSKVVFQADFSVTAGVQYDRTAQIFIGNVNVLFGTTAEPQSDVSPSWHVERDLTDYSALLTAPQSGFAFIGNVVNSTYTGVIYGTASLVFYPPDSSNPAPVVPDQVLPLNGAGSATLSTTSSQLAQSFTLPTNVQNAYLDIVAQSQSADEFWYTCVPDDVATQLQSCGGTAFREVEVSIDGKPAGVAPVYPWIYTGGISPKLWIPIPGVQTLNFPPYRVDLSPFASVLSNGQPHSVAVSVYNADNYFAATATLLLVLDHGSTKLTGAVTTNTLAAAPTPVVQENLRGGANGGGTVGTVNVTSARSYSVAGYVDTSKGRITTQLDQTLNFASKQQFNTVAGYVQNITQTSTVAASTKITNGSGVTQTSTVNLSDPLTLNYSPTASSIQQQYIGSVTQPLANGTTYTSSLTNTVAPSVSGAQATGSQHYVFKDSTGACYDRSISGSRGYVTNVKDVCATQ